MSTLNDAWQEWTRQVQLPGNISQTEATDILQTFGPTLTDEDGDAWWDAVAIEYERLNIITPGTYVGLRNYANNNEQGANDLFDGLLPGSVGALPETGPVDDAIRQQSLIDEQAEIPGNVLIIEGNKTGGTSVQEVQLDQAYDIAIAALENRDQQITDELLQFS